MRIVCFSSFTFAYLDRARVLYHSLRKWHPDWHLVALITDVAPDSIFFDTGSEPFDEIVFASDLGILNFNSWIFQHDIVEACTAVKGPFFANYVNRCDIIVYLDPDICLFSPLDCIDLLKNGDADILLTPHQLKPDSAETAVIDNEITSLATGIYNLGFIAISAKGPGKAFAQWWRDRLLSFCHDDIARGLFVDQRWCDHVPVFFDNVHIIKDPGYNVASWNLSQREVFINSSGSILVNELPLRFWHFTKLGAVGDAMTRRYAGDNYAVHEIWNWYRYQVEQNKVEGLPPKYWAFAVYDDGVQIKREDRLKFREIRQIQSRFPDPFLSSGDDTFRQWIADNGRD